LVVAALGASSAMAQSQPLTRDQVKADLAQAQSSGALERNDQNYGTWWADTPSSPNYSQSYSTGPASSDTGMASNSTMSPDSSSMGAAGRSYDSGSTGTGTGMSSDSSSSSTLQGNTTSTPMGTTSTYGSGSSAMGAAGRSYDGSTASGPASRADVAADRDNAMRSGRWVFNDEDGVRRLDPGESSLSGRTFKGPADSY
jgi:hypothetical protein